MPGKQKHSSVDYIQAINPQGYLNNREITNLPGQFLVKGSKNCLIVNKEKVASRKGFTLVGSAKTKNKGHNGSYDWETNTKIWRNLRFNKAGELEVYYKSDWHLLKTFSRFDEAQFAPWWDANKLIDLLLFVVGDDTVNSWSGGIAEIASFTDTTITKKGYVTGATLKFSDNGASADTIEWEGITDPVTQGFVVAGFAAGDTIEISGTTFNNGKYQVATVTESLITLVADDVLETETSTTSAVLSWLNASWAESRFLNSGTRKILINGTEYEYTGGESTGTLTGLSGLAASGVAAGSTVFQAVTVSSPSTLSGFSCDLIDVIQNYAFIASKTSRAVYISKSSDYTNFSYSTPARKAGEGFLLLLDSTPTALVSTEEAEYISAGHDDWYKVLFKLSSTTVGGEDITITKLKSSAGQAAVNQGVVVKIRNSVAYLSFEPTIDSLGNVEFINQQQSVPISDEIRNDLEAYDLTGAHGLYFRRNLLFALPAEGLVLIYDTRFQYWQSPQELPVGRLALIDIDGDGKVYLCGHSSVSNETYKLFDGYSDNGAKFKVVMAFGYENYGARFTPKQFDEAAVELYMSTNTQVMDEILYDYKGGTDIRQFVIDGADDRGRVTPRVLGGSLGTAPLGYNPLGSVQDEFDDLSKHRVVSMTSVLDFFERQRVFSCDSEDQRWEVIAYGENVELSDSLPNDIKR